MTDRNWAIGDKVRLGDWPWPMIVLALDGEHVVVGWASGAWRDNEAWVHPGALRADEA